MSRPTPITQLVAKFPFLNGMGNEFLLDMEPAVVPTTNPMPQIVDFRSHFKWKDNNYLDVIAMGIKNTALKDLYQKASSKYSNGDVYLTALRIHHGASGYSQELFFSPLYLKSTDGGVNFQVTELGRYMYDHQNEVFIEGVASGVDIEYRTNIYVKPTLAGSFGNFSSGADVESVTYPFQTIYTMIFDSLTYNENYVTITNALPKDKATGNLLIKHSLLLMAAETEIGAIYPTFHGNYANRSHLCPPGCRIISDLDKA
ncbi:hypothetical protein [Fluviicola chungangensis]|uniref:Uncharacterized protein n=1 Tax=Fluviicola chungangensis TaxID=2597671 RepID=A0A556MZN4_9FLAO|nr:hypothetical protein [Fluviicola chungangensis]TSJ45381.1 hypothetical protein FO442_06415 [Fluviicola chungangensis]